MKENQVKCLHPQHFERKLSKASSGCINPTCVPTACTIGTAGMYSALVACKKKYSRFSKIFQVFVQSASRLLQVLWRIVPVTLPCVISSYRIQVCLRLCQQFLLRRSCNQAHTWCNGTWPVANARCVHQQVAQGHCVSQPLCSIASFNLHALMEKKVSKSV